MSCSKLDEEKRNYTLAYYFEQFGQWKQLLQSTNKNNFLKKSRTLNVGEVL